MEDIRIQDDLFQYANGEWLKTAVIPDDKPATGGFSDIAVEVEKTMMQEFLDMSKAKKYPDKYLENTIKLFDLIRDTDRRDRDGIAPLLPALKRLDDLKDIKDFNNELKGLVEDGMPLPFQLDVTEDMKDANHHCLLIVGPETFLPDSSYYKEAMKEQKKVFIKAWTAMAKSVMAKTNLSKKAQKLYIDDAIAFDELVASLVKSNEEWADYVKMYNPMKLTRVNSMMKPVKFKDLVNDIFGEDVDTVVVADPRYFKGFKTVFNAETFELYKHWAYVKLLLQVAEYLTEELRELAASYRLAITGVKAIAELDKYAYQTAGFFFSEPVGKYYGEKYFGEAAKKDVTEMVKEIIETYKNRVRRNDILTDATKEKAVLKLNTMGLKLAFPDKVEALYDKLIVDETKSLLENMADLSKVKRLDSFSKLKKDVDKTKWVMPGHMVNACYNPTLNDITFPAAILKAPFYSIDQTRSQNLGGIGAVIAHEISHAFDNNGAKFDENGNLNNWWTKEDTRRFNARTKAMVKQFDKIELPWGTVNGKFIVSENIADNGGVAATLEVMSNMKEKSYEEYFINWGTIWRQKASDEYKKLILAVDVHGPNVLRANMPPRNFEEWYETFDVKKTDEMYLPPNKRVVIW